jgi:hypothetical protein
LLLDLDDDVDCSRKITFENKEINIREEIRSAFTNPAIPYSIDFHRQSIELLVETMVKRKIIDERRIQGSFHFPFYSLLRWHESIEGMERMAIE